AVRRRGSRDPGARHRASPSCAERRGLASASRANDTMARRLTSRRRRTIGVIAYMLAGGCHYAGPLAGGGSEFREGGLPDRVSRFLAEGGGARTVDELLPASVGDSAAIYLVVVDQRALGIGNAQVAILPHTM